MKAQQKICLPPNYNRHKKTPHANAEGFQGR